MEDTTVCPLDFDTLREANVSRCESAFFLLYAWSPNDWATALAGEVGELCNLLKKMRRGDVVDPAEIAKELGDIVTYADLLAARLGIDLGEATRAKFNEVSDRRGSAIKL